jgi:hypothetical protein
MAYGIKKKNIVQKDFKNSDEKYTSQLKEIYSFSHSDNEIETKYLTPDEFLEFTYKEYQLREPNSTKSFHSYKHDVLFEDNVNWHKDVFTGKKKSKYAIPKPFLEFDVNGKPYGHEGRNTVQALKELGVKKVPVTISKSKSYDITKPRW